MDGCVFCKIVSGELPCHKIYEDENFLGFLDINPLSLGNSLLISKKHYRWVYDVPNFGNYWEAAKIISLATKKVVKGCDSIGYLTLGYEIPHAHIRIVPRFLNDDHTDGIMISKVKKIEKEEMEEIGGKIQEEIKRLRVIKKSGR
jgi:histidine triad (HIT) family protein